MTPRKGAAIGGVIGTAAGFVVGVVAAEATRAPASPRAGWLMLGGIVVGSITGAVVGAGKTPGSTAGYFSGAPYQTGPVQLPSKPALAL
jgi:hypothetical protein